MRTNQITRIIFLAFPQGVPQSFTSMFEIKPHKPKLLNIIEIIKSKQIIIIEANKPKLIIIICLTS